MLLHQLGIAMSVHLQYLQDHVLGLGADVEEADEGTHHHSQAILTREVQVEEGDGYDDGWVG
jgi:hypothetical protein